MDIGIDLGTTFSVIAVKGNVTLAAGYPQGMYLEDCDVTIIPAPTGDYTFPSVLWWEQEDPDVYLVGGEAKQKAEEGRRPIMFSKRSIGTGEELKLNGRMFTAKEVATHFLRHLKDCAERALGQSVRRAVVTHPAYFDPNQVQETREAAEDAGFEMSPQQMMMEPAAAAMAYTLNDARDPLRVLAYDLGGGTFDVTVLERSMGVITMKSFDGDHLLGGYNFDRALVQWILDDLKAQGRKIPYDERNEDDRGRHARLLHAVETIKIKLSEQRTAKAPVPVKIDFLVDQQGNKVQFVGKITREQFAELIKDSLQDTIDCCRRALAKARMEAEELDAILLVGGSTYGPWVQEAVSKAFNQNVQPYNPDLCVAAGAALEAAKLPQTTTGTEIELELEVAAASALPSTNVRGVIRPREKSSYDAIACRRLIVMLAVPGGAVLAPAAIDENGQFLFQDVELADEGQAEFTLTISDGKYELLKRVFAIRYQPEGTGETPINTVLPKPIYLKTADGLVSVAEEGVPLPAKCEIKLKKLFGDARVEVPVLQEFEQIGSIQVDNIPETAGEGSLVVIAVEITQKNEMRGTARVLTRTGSEVARRDVRVGFPPIAIPNLVELNANFDDLNDRRQQAIHLTQDPEERLALAGSGEKLVKKLRKLFEQEEPDRQEINRELKKLDRMINPPKDDMEPPRTSFQSILEACRELLASKADDPAMQAFHSRLKRIETEGNDAYTTKNRKKWAAANEALRQEHSRIEKATGGGDGPPPELPPTPVLKDAFRHDADAMRAAVRMARESAAKRPTYATRDKPRCDSLEREIDKMEKAIDEVKDDQESKQALAQLQLIMRPAGGIKQRTRWIEEGIDVQQA